MKLPVVISEDENGYIVAHCPVLNGCKSEGKTEKEALVNLKKEIMQSMVASNGIKPQILEKIKIKEISI